MEYLQANNLIKVPVHLYRYCKRTVDTLKSLDLGFYWFWVWLRVGLTLLPQTGYIHPDEYFQTVEVFAGNVFDFEVSLPWEFNTTFPIRSVTLLYATIHVPFALLRRVADLLGYYFGVNVVTHYTLLVVPRLTMCLISFISDVCLFKICYQFCQNYKERLIMQASSFVSIVFMTRTFTNTLEIACFNVLLYLVSSCMAESEKVNYQNDFLKDKYTEASTIPDRVRITKLIKLLPRHSLKRSLPIAAVTVLGVFNRPTFVLYALTPLFYWFQRGLTVRSTYLRDFHARIFIFVLCCVPLVCLLVYLDSAYYGYLTWGELLNLDIGTDNFVVTPLNFVKYNMDPENLAEHGVHPRFLHFLVNIPLLFNVLGVSGLIVLLKLCYRSTFSNWTLLPKSQSITGMMTLSFVVPVLGLSVFSHQEPRFIAPVLLPLVFLYSHVVREFDEDCALVVPFRKRRPIRPTAPNSSLLQYPLRVIDYLGRATETFDNRYNINGRYLTNLRKRDVVESHKSATPSAAAAGDATCDADAASTTTTTTEVPDKSTGTCRPEVRRSRKRYLTYLWYGLNCLSVLFFGFLHQGGLYGLSRNFHSKLLLKPKYTTYHLVTSHMYSLPHHLLSVKRHQKYKNTNFVAHELGTRDFDDINLKLTTILRLAESKRASMRRNYRVFYAVPLSILNEFKSSHEEYYSGNFSYRLDGLYYPHFSTEAPPTFRPGWPSPFEALASLRDLYDLVGQFGLALLEVSLPE